MKDFLRIVVLACLAWHGSMSAGLAAPAENSKPGAEVQGLKDGGIVVYSCSSISVLFSTPMVSADKIDVKTKDVPIRFDPPLSGEFLWKSQTEGEFTLGAVAPETDSRILLSPGLTNLAGQPLKSTESLGRVTSDPFTVQCDFQPGKLTRRPAVPLSFTYPVRGTDLATAAWFVDRDTRERFPVDVILEEDEEPSVQMATVTPRSDLAGGHTYDLVVDGLKSVGIGARLSKLFVQPLGTTDSLLVEKVAAFNYPLQKRRIAVEFNQAVSPSQGGKIKIEPEVAGLKCSAEENALWLEGDYDLGVRYTVTIPADVKGDLGFTLPTESRWGATFHAKKPAIIFPDEDLHERSMLGLHFGFVQVNTGPLSWKLARVPPEKLLAVNERLREFTKGRPDPVTGNPLIDPVTGAPFCTPTELLIDASKLQVVAQGAIGASEPEADTMREIDWKPENEIPPGAYVLEITGTNAEGKVMGNRALITFTEYAAAQKIFAQTRMLHLMNIATGQPVPGVTIRAVTDANEAVAKGVTDTNGNLSFSGPVLFPTGDPSKAAEWFLIGTPDGPAIQPVTAQGFQNTGYSWLGGNGEENAGPDYRCAITTDRPLYRPGQTVKIKGFLRVADANGNLEIPRLQAVDWSIADDDGQSMASGTASLDDYGGMEGEWKMPDSLKVGTYQLTATLGDAPLPGATLFAVQEFRPPPFTVALEDLKLPGTRAGVRIKSAYFHGAANAGARVRWKVTWTKQPSGDTSIIMTNGHPELASVEVRNEEKTSGEATIGADGTVEVESASPFDKGEAEGWYSVDWIAEVTAVDGQTIEEEATFPVYAVPVQLTVSGSQVAGAQDPLKISLGADAAGPELKEVPNVAVAEDVYLISTKTAKEQISTNVYRYHNSTAFEKIDTIKGRTPLTGVVDVKAAGEYLIVARDMDDPKIPAVPERVHVAGPDEAEFAVRDEESIDVTADKPAGSGKYVPGETAAVSVEAPFSGVAWVTVEANTILDSFLVPLSGNSARIDVPIKKNYAPNAWTSVYLFRPGGDSKLPAERFGAAAIEIRRPDLELQVTPQLDSTEVQPKGRVSGAVVITGEGRPVANADVTLYAVDEAVLDAGDWHEPALGADMYPRREWTVGTLHALERLSIGVDTASLHQKGFIIGAFKGESLNVKDLRTNFPPLAYWQTHLRTDNNGKVPFAFTAPDALTRYRVIALAQTKQSQFGTGSSAVEVSKPVQIEPALPRFLRVGDEVELRAIVREKIADTLPVTVQCSTGLKLEGDASQTQTVRRGLPSVFLFRAVVGDLSSVKVRFQTNAGPGDAVEMTLPVYPATILQKEEVSGKTQDILARIPKTWADAGGGSADVFVSSSSWLPILLGLPQLLDYPHGCFEQITTRVLGYTALNGLLASLPETAGQQNDYRVRVEAGIQKMAEDQLPDGGLPYWPGESQASLLPTIAGYWSVKNAASQGMTVPKKLTDGLAGEVQRIVTGEESADPFLRAYALMVMAANGGAAKTLVPVARELYLRRQNFDDETRALLALALHSLKQMPDAQIQLLREINRPQEEKGFNPDTFCSTMRADAIRTLAFAIIKLPGAPAVPLDAFLESVHDSLDLSTQEDFWALLALQAIAPSGSKVELKPMPGVSPPDALSKNGESVLWTEPDILSREAFSWLAKLNPDLTTVIKAQYRSASPDTERVDRGIHVERVVKNLTDASRTGEAKAPFKLGDQILITYRIASSKLNYYVALEDEIPAGLEVINPDIASIAATYSLPPEADQNQAYLSHDELLDKVTRLYFDKLDPGTNVYSVLARATCAGVFHWPATQVEPMYDSRVSGLSASSVCNISGQ